MKKMIGNKPIFYINTSILLALPLMLVGCKNNFMNQKSSSDAECVCEDSLNLATTPMDVTENTKTVTLKLELPAVSEKDVKIAIDQNHITISGEKKIDAIEQGATYHLCERAFGKFSRRMELPFIIEKGKTKAIFKDGVLTIIIQKTETNSNTKTIPIITDNKEIERAI